VRITTARRVAPIEYPFLHEWDRSRYSPGYLRSGPSEEDVQAAIVHALRLRWRAVVTEIDVGDKRLRGRLGRLGLDRRVISAAGGGNKRGVVDLAVTFPGGRAGWFEVKKPEFCVVSKSTGQLIRERAPGELSDEQLEFLLAQSRVGAVVGGLWAVEDLFACIPGATP
jgi:hypothetical protein